MVGAVRATQWAKLLPEHGWQVIVARKHHGYTATDEELARSVHPDLDLRHLTSAPSVFSAQRMGRFARAKTVLANGLRQYVLAPDPGIVFWRRIGETVTRIVKEVRPDAVITTGPPNSIHAAGLRIKQVFPDLPWLADFRDVYRHSGRYRARWFEAYHSFQNWRFEEEAYRVADRIICAIPTHERWIRKRFPQAVSKTVLLLNGTPDELLGAPLPNDSAEGEAFIKVVGFSEARESAFLAQAVVNLRRAGKKIRLKFVGRFPSVKSEIEELLGNGVVFTGPIRHDQALEEIVSAGVLVAVLSENRSRVFGISSKLFEYLAVSTPVIVINPTRPDKRLFSRLSGVWMLTTPTPADIEVALRAALQAPADELSARAALFREKWSRRSQVAQLASILDDLCRRSTEISVETPNA